MNDNIKLLSDFIIYSKYARYLQKENRREVWKEIVDRNKKMHINKFPKLKEEIENAYKYVYDKKVVPSMRSLQFGGKPIDINNSRIYNCSYLPIDDWRAFPEIMFLLLSGCGVGFSVQKHHIEKLPEIRKPNPERIKRFLIGDSIEGWADAIKYLLKSYFFGGPTLNFDYRDIRPKGERLITSGGRAPGPDPLKMCIENIKNLLDKKKDGDKLSSLEVHDIVCYISDCVLAGGIRRSALISLFSVNDEYMIECKSNFKILNWCYLYKEGPVNQAGEKTKVVSVNEVKYGDLVKKYYDLLVEVDEPFYGISKKEVYWVSEDDIEKYLKIKSVLPWYYFQPQRGRANNSVVLLRSKVDKRTFKKIWKKLENSNSGEPGFYLTHDKDWGTNPCAEIALRPNQFCNLTEVNVSDIESQEDLENRVKAAAFIGTLQASYTDFHYLRDVWKKTTEKESLLGISLTGIASGKIFNLNVQKAVDVAKNENERVANLIGINKAARITTIKPSGTAALLLGVSSGIHAWFDKYYIRRVRIGKNEAIYSYLKKNIPELLEDDLFSDNISIIKFPIEAPDRSIFRNESVINFLERIKYFYENWIKPGHNTGMNTHNISATVFVKDDEWDIVGEWMWNNREFYNGISILPYDGGTYKQAPFESITKEEYDKLCSYIKNIDFKEIKEFNDGVNFNEIVACSGASCEII